MKIHSLELRNVRGVEHLVLSDIPATGVMIIHGDNEAGKSTILDGLAAVLNVKYSSKGKDIKALAPVGKDVAPEVTLKATIGPYTFRIWKRFLRKPKCELNITAPQHQQFAGREADDRLAEIISGHLDETLAEALFLRQGELDLGIAAAGIPSITHALDGVSEEGGSGTEDTALMERISKEYGEYFTDKGQEKASYKALEVAVNEREAELRVLAEEWESLRQFVEEVERREEELRTIERELPEAVIEEEERGAEAKAAAELAEKAARAGEEEQRRAKERDRAEADLAARTEAVAQLAALEKDAVAQGAKLAEAAEQAEEEAGKAAELTEVRDEAKAAVARAREEAKRAEAARQRSRSRAKLAELDALITRLDEADEELSALKAKRPDVVVTAADLRALEKAHEKVAVASSLASAAAAKLEVTGPSDGTLRIDGEEVAFDGRATVSALEGTAVGIGEYTVTYRAGDGAGDRNEKLEEALRAEEKLLAALGCADLDQARARRDEHAELLTAIEASERRVKDLLDGRNAQELKEERDRLRAREEEHGEAGVGRGAADETEAEAVLEGAQRRLDEATEELERAEAELKPWAERKHATALAVLESRAESTRAQISAAQAKLEEARAAASDGDLEAARDAAATALEEARRAAGEFGEQLAAANPALAANLLEGARTRVRNLKTRHSEATNRVAELKGRIEQATGVAEEADQAEARLDAARTDLARARKRAEAIKLLRETMMRHRDAARARYAAPFAQALTRYAEVVFGAGVEFELSDSLEVRARTQGDTTVDLPQLSGGAQEQLALCIRFAIADLVGAGEDSAEEVPVIIDDALGATDPTRLSLMNSLVARVGARTQVFVLTCYPQRFDRVPAAKLASIEELKARA
ncbi:ATP-binding protein [Corynebacterium liangguodongii]|uniref:ATP-binding protein n=1 Tax=Corynebacterium liangguodongii TaxID=2079535 RepID=A0A2S0WDK2_9CORY|nr:ATP-binding protein [Corynebacterium liangguodongii]AWB83814.1 ATP-binding protein [Corynebacterium liangguodongii]PWB98935.1 ATP-binding protein [Corynebacterium liangguodongii]